MRKKYIIIPAGIILFSLLFAQCSLYKTMMNISRLKFKLNGIQEVYIGGISVQGKSRIQDFSIIEIASVTSSLAKGRLPIQFVLNVAAVNPNDGKGGYARTDASLKSFPYRLVIDNKEIISGNIASPVTIPGTGEQSIIPLSISFDLLQAFKDNSYQSMLNLALNISGNSSTPSKVELFATPTVSTVIGDIRYPGELKIIDAQFSDR